MHLFISQPPQFAPGDQDDTQAAAPARKNSGMICSSHVSAWKTTEVVSMLSQISTCCRMMLIAITVWPSTTPTNEVMRMTSSARSRSAGVLAASVAASGNLKSVVIDSHSLFGRCVGLSVAGPAWASPISVADHRVAAHGRNYAFGPSSST